MIHTVGAAEGGHFGGFMVWATNSVTEQHAALRKQAHCRKEGGACLPHCLTNSPFLPMRLNRTGEWRVHSPGRGDASVVLGRRCASTQTRMHQIDADDGRDDQYDDQRPAGFVPQVTCTCCGAIIPTTSTTVDGGRECRRCGRVERTLGGASA